MSTNTQTELIDKYFAPAFETKVRRNPGYRNEPMDVIKEVFIDIIRKGEENEGIPTDAFGNYLIEWAIAGADWGHIITKAMKGAWMNQTMRVDMAFSSTLYSIASVMRLHGLEQGELLSQTAKEFEEAVLRIAKDKDNYRYIHEFIDTAISYYLNGVNWLELARLYVIDED
jgi:hypothetical protein